MSTSPRAFGSEITILAHPRAACEAPETPVIGRLAAGPELRLCLAIANRSTSASHDRSRCLPGLRSSGPEPSLASSGSSPSHPSAAAMPFDLCSIHAARCARWIAQAPPCSRCSRLLQAALGSEGGSCSCSTAGPGQGFKTDGKLRGVDMQGSGVQCASARHASSSCGQRTRRGTLLPPLACRRCRHLVQTRRRWLLTSRCRMAATCAAWPLTPNRQVRCRACVCWLLFVLPAGISGRGCTRPGRQGDPRLMQAQPAATW